MVHIQIHQVHHWKYRYILVFGHEAGKLMFAHVQTDTSIRVNCLTLVMNPDGHVDGSHLLFAFSPFVPREQQWLRLR